MKHDGFECHYPAGEILLEVEAWPMSIPEKLDWLLSRLHVDMHFLFLSHKVGIVSSYRFH